MFSEIIIKYGLSIYYAVRYICYICYVPKLITKKNSRVSLLSNVHVVHGHTYEHPWTYDMYNVHVVVVHALKKKIN